MDARIEAVIDKHRFHNCDCSCPASCRIHLVQDVGEVLAAVARLAVLADEYAPLAILRAVDVQKSQS